MKKKCYIMLLMSFMCARAFVDSDRLFFCLTEASDQEPVFSDSDDERFLEELENDQALEPFQERDEQGWYELRNACALLQEENPDYNRIHQSFERLVGPGHERELQGLAHYNLGLLYLDGRGVSQDMEQAQAHFNRALENEQLPLNVRASVQFGQGRIYYTIALSQDDQHERARLFSEARRLFSELVDDTDARSSDRAQANYMLGMLTLKGRGVARDYSWARKYFERATEPNSGLPLADCITAHSTLAALYFNGAGCRKDYGEAVRHAQFVKGNSTRAPGMLPFANYMLGIMYCKGSVDLEKNHEKARECLEQALSSDSIISQQRCNVQASLGDIYFKQGNLYAAKKLLESVVSQRELLDSRTYVAAQYTLAQVYCDTDLAVGQNISQARVYFDAVARSECDISATMRSGAQKTVRLIDRLSDTENRPKKRARLR